MNIKFVILYPRFIALQFYDCIFLIFNLVSQIVVEKKIKMLTAEINSWLHKRNTKFCLIIWEQMLCEVVRGKEA